MIHIHLHDLWNSFWAMDKEPNSAGACEKDYPFIFYTSGAL